MLAELIAGFFRLGNERAAVQQEPQASQQVETEPPAPEQQPEAESRTHLVQVCFWAQFDLAELRIRQWMRENGKK